MMLRGRDDNGILKSGFLWKRTKGSIKKWKLYFFVLSRPCLLCFKSEDQMKEGVDPKYKLELCDISMVEILDKKKRKSKRFFICYETLHDHGILHLKGHDFSDAFNWMNYITATSEFCKRRKDVHSELKTASFKLNVEHIVRQRMLDSNPTSKSKQVPQVTYLRKVASCEFLNKEKDTKFAAEIKDKHRSRSMDGDLSSRSGSWRFSSPRPLVGHRQSQGGVARSNTSASTTSYSRAVLDSTKRDYSRSNNNNFQNNLKPTPNGKGLISRHNSLLTVVPEEKTPNNRGNKDWLESRSSFRAYSGERRDSADGQSVKSERSERRIDSVQNQYSRASFASNGRSGSFSDHEGDLQKYSRLDYSISGRVAQRNGMESQRGLPKYQSFHGELNRGAGKFERNSPAYSSLQAPSSGAHGAMNNRYYNRGQQRQDTYGSGHPTSPFPSSQTNAQDRYASTGGGGYLGDPSRNRRPSGYAGGVGMPRRVSPPGSLNVQAFGDPKFRIEEGRVWSERNSDTWSDIDSGYVEERF